MLTCCFAGILILNLKISRGLLQYLSIGVLDGVPCEEACIWAGKGGLEVPSGPQGLHEGANQQ